MYHDDPNPLDSPESMGLTILAGLGDPYLSYEFRLLYLWKHADGRLFWAGDSGCSCPRPFEWATTLEDLNLLTDETWDTFAERVNGFVHYELEGENQVDHDPEGKIAVRRTDMLRIAAQALREAPAAEEVEKPLILSTQDLLDWAEHWISVAVATEKEFKRLRRCVAALDELAHQSRYVAITPHWPEIMVI